MDDVNRIISAIIEKSIVVEFDSHKSRFMFQFKNFADGQHDIGLEIAQIKELVLEQLNKT